MKLDSTTGVVPTNTTKIRFSIIDSGNKTGSNDAAIDNLSFVIVPEPSSFILTLIGSLFTILKRRK